MVEPITTVGLGAVAAYLGKDGLEKLLGPTAEYLGGGLKDLVQKRSEAIGRIFQNASEKLGEKIEEPGEIPPKLLKHVLDHGSFANDTVEIEYLGGIVASSRTADSRDNRGVRFAKKVDSLSNYQILAHYLAYQSIKNIFSDAKISATFEGRRKLQIYIPISDFVRSMNLNQNEISNLSAILTHTFFGLYDDALIENEFQFGPTESIKSKYAAATESGIVIQPSSSGIQLFLWAFGEGDAMVDKIFDPTFSSAIHGIANGFPNALPIFDPKQELR